MNIKKTIVLAMAMLVLLWTSACAAADPAEPSEEQKTEETVVSAEISEEETAEVSEAPAESLQETETTPTPEPFVAEESPTIEQLQQEVPQLFTQHEYHDKETGLSVSYNLFLPEDYDESQSYPLVMFIPDSTSVGKGVEATLSHYGCLIWASEAVQKDDPCIVLAPMYSQVIIDDHGSYTTTDYMPLTRNLILWIAENYSVDTNRIYGTGQSMGAMTTMYLAAQYPDLFAACLIVDGQWDPAELTGLAESKMFYFAAEGDDKAYSGMQALQPVLEAAGAEITNGKWNAKWDLETMHNALDEVLAEGTDLNFIVWELGSVMAEGQNARFGEHMSSFVHPYKVHGVRHWLLSQTAE